MKHFIKNKKKCCFVGLFIFLLVVSGCENNSVSSDGYEFATEEVQVINVFSEKNLVVENKNGKITIADSDTAKNINFNAIKRVRSYESESDAKAHISDINLEVSQNNNDIKITVEHPQSSKRNYEVDLELLVPVNFLYDISLGNGNVSVIVTTNNLIINLGNGNILSNAFLTDTCFSSVSLGNGALNYRIPETTNARLTATVGNGTIENNGLNFLNQKSSDRQFSGMLGDGSGTINLNVGNGAITMSKR